jgi:succinylglutamate desuccinylase
LEETFADRRVLGRIAGEDDGPTLIVTACIHGNEPAGIEAAARVLAHLDQQRTSVRGRLVIVTGNLPALQARARFVDQDLNRCWTPQKVNGLRAGVHGEEAPAEDHEQRELIQVLEQELESAAGPLYFLDLHTSSAEGPPFLTVGDTLYNRRFASNFPLPLILGLEEQVDGALLEYLNNLGFVTLGVEAGQHDSAESTLRLESVLWLALVHAGLIAEGDAPDLSEGRRTLREASRGVPRVIEVRSRHAITPVDQFRMEPGFSNFHPVRKGELLARDEHGLVLAPESGRVLLPLYQGKGNDGFFIAREVRGFWLKLSFLLRQLRLGALLRFLPGVRRERRRPEVLFVDTRIARFYTLEVFHLFGFRKLRRSGSELIMSRRRFDLRPPAPGTMREIC